MVTQSGEVWMSETLERKVLQASATLDWAAGTVKVPPVWVGYVLQFLGVREGRPGQQDRREEKEQDTAQIPSHRITFSFRAAGLNLWRRTETPLPS